MARADPPRWAIIVAGALSACHKAGGDAMVFAVEILVAATKICAPSKRAQAHGDFRKACFGLVIANS